MYLTKENDAKAFSEALIRAKLVDAPAGDRRVRELFNKTFPDLANKKWANYIKAVTKAKIAASPRLIAVAKAAAAAAERQSPQSSLTSSDVAAPPPRPRASGVAAAPSISQQKRKASHPSLQNFFRRRTKQPQRNDPGPSPSTEPSRE